MPQEGIFGATRRDVFGNSSAEYKRNPIQKSGAKRRKIVECSGAHGSKKVNILHFVPSQGQGVAQDKH